MTNRRFDTAVLNSVQNSPAALCETADGSPPVKTRNLRFRSYPHVRGQCIADFSFSGLAVSDTRKKVFGSLIPQLWRNSFWGEGFQKTLLYIAYTGNQDIFEIIDFVLLVRHHLLCATTVYATSPPTAAADK